MGPEVTQLKLSDGSKLPVKCYGEEYFGQYLGKDVKAPVYSFKALGWFIDQVNHYTKHKFDQITLLTGDERSGKSTLEFEIATALDPNFSLSNVTFTQEEVMRKCQTLADESVIMMDEAGAAMFSQEWMQRGQRELVKAFQVFGVKRLRFLITLPHRKLLNYQLRNRRVHWWFHVYTKGVRRGYAQLRRAVHDKWETQAFWEPVFAFRFPKFTGDLWDEYEKRKLKFIAEQLAGKHSSKADAPSDAQKRLHGAAEMLHHEGKDTKEIARLLGYSRQHMYDIVKKITKKETTTIEPSSE